MIPWYFSFDETRRLPELVEGATTNKTGEGQEEEAETQTEREDGERREDGCGGGAGARRLSPSLARSLPLSRSLSRSSLAVLRGLGGL